MKQRNVLLWLVVAGLVFLMVPPVSAERWDIIHVLCIDKIVDIRIPPIPVGCEMIDCCPGCPGPDIIDWRIRVTGDPIKAITLGFEDLSPQAAKLIRIKGNAKWLKGNRLQLGKGETFLRGFAVKPKARPAVAIPSIIIDKAKIKTLVSTANKDPETAIKDSSKLEFVVEQMLGKVVVNEFRLVYLFKICHQPPFKLQDQINLSNNTANDSAVFLLDARSSSGCVNDGMWRGSNVISVGNLLSNGVCNSETAIFSDDNAMQLVTPVNVWTDSGGDTLPVNMTPLLQAPVTVRLLMANTLARAQGDIANANFLYNTNNSGIGFNANYIDLSNNQNAVILVGTNTNNMCTAAWRTTLTGSAFHTAGRVNVYYVNSAFTGLMCVADPNIIVVGTTANNQTLAHELGHSFSLDHTNGVAGFGNINVMQGGGANRTHFSEGQSFRMNINTTSAINTNGVRAGTTRNCPDTTTSNTCPALSLDVTPK